MNQPKPKITSIRYYTTKIRKQPKVGDARVTKKHGLQIRVWARAKCFASGKPIGFLVSNGRPVFEWVKPKDIAPWDAYLLEGLEDAN